MKFILFFYQVGPSQPQTTQLQTTGSSTGQTGISGTSYGMNFIYNVIIVIVEYI